MSKEMLAVLAGGLVSGLFYLSAAGEVPGAILLFNVAQLPLFVAALGLGATAGVMAGVSGFVIAGLIGGALAALGYVVVNAAPVVLVSRQALLSRAGAGGAVEWYPPGLLMAWLTGLGTILLVGATIVFAGAEGGLEAYVRTTLADALQTLAAAEDQARIASMAEALAPYVPGLVVASWMVVVTVNGALAQGALVRLGRNLRPTPDIARLELPQWMPLALAVAVLLALFGGGGVGFVGQNLAFVLAVPFFFSGLAVVHALVRKLSGGPLVLAMFYMFLLIFGWAVVLVAGLGLIEQWAGFRRQWLTKDSGEEDE